MEGSDIAKQWNEVRAQVPADVHVVAVSKTKPVSAVEQAYSAEESSLS